MTLFKLGIAYTELNTNVLLLHSRTAILEYLRLCSGQYTQPDLKARTPYQRRSHQDALAELYQRELLALERGIPSKVDIPKEKTVAVPTNAPWAELSLAELKVYIALFAASRHSRSPYFRFTGRHDDLAEIARLNRKATGHALFSLQSKGLLTLKVVREEGRRWTSGTSAQLLDPRNGASLNDLAWVFINLLDKLSPLDKYKEALRRVDLSIISLTGYARGFRVMCPFCSTPKALRINVTEDEDAWFCSECKKHGNSNSLCAAQSFWMWRQGTPLSASVAAMASDVPMALAGVGQEGTQNASL